MLEILSSVIDLLREINVNNTINTFSSLDSNRQITMNVITELNNRQMSHWFEIYAMDRATLFYVAI